MPRRWHAPCADGAMACGWRSRAWPSIDWPVDRHRAQRMVFRDSLFRRDVAEPPYSEDRSADADYARDVNGSFPENSNTLLGHIPDEMRFVRNAWSSNGPCHRSGSLFAMA
jgi:hypothetical protein